MPFGNRLVLLVIGTRPEAIKLAPLYFELERSGFKPLVCATYQQKQLLGHALDMFGIEPDFRLDVMKPGQSLGELSGALLTGLGDLYSQIQPSLVIVQGDTATVLCAAMAAFYAGIRVAHVEAGLRTGNLRAPFPEEANRCALRIFADLHFAPTIRAMAHLLSEGVAPENVFCVGNTVVDALRIVRQRISSGLIDVSLVVRSLVERCRRDELKLILVTLHRREAFDGKIRSACGVINKFAKKHADILVLYLRHPNPCVSKAASWLGAHELPERVVVWDPLSPGDMIYLLPHTAFIVTDSGGLQEEGVSLGKHVICVREVTERLEGVEEGFIRVVGFENEVLGNALEECYSEIGIGDTSGELCTSQRNPFGDGFAASKIVRILQQQLRMSFKHSANASRRCLSGESMRVNTVSSKKKTISVVGLGYIGLPTALVASQAGFCVHGFDINCRRIEQIQSIKVESVEVSLRKSLESELGKGTFSVSCELRAADYFLICVPTPLTDGKVDLAAVWSACDRVCGVLKPRGTVILESTVPVGTTRKFASYIEQKTGMVAGKDFFVAHCPERVIPGKIFEELVSNDRIIGGLTDSCTEKACAFYSAFVRGMLHKSCADTAEMTKLVENSCRDVQIAFANQVSQLCAASGVNVHRVIELANKHPRVKILRPGPGVGGHCVAVDPQFLIGAFPNDSELLSAARKFNQERPVRIVEHTIKICEKLYKHGTKKPKVIILGLAYKPDVDDLRESPALEIAESLNRCKNRCSVEVCEPNVSISHPKLHGLNVVSDWCKAIRESDVVLILVPHRQFWSISAKMCAYKHVLDPTGLMHHICSSMCSNEDSLDDDTAFCMTTL